MKNTFFILVFVCFLGCKESKKTNTFDRLSDLKHLVDLNGEPFSMTHLKGKKVLVNYWATWCAPCKKEMPDLLEAQKILAANNYVFLLISDESEAKIQNFRDQNKYDFSFLRMTTSLSNLGIYALPTTYVYNEKGEKVKKIIGAVKWNSKEMITQLKEL